MDKKQSQTMKCGCGQEFRSREEFDRHAKTCPMGRSSEGGQGGKTKTAG